MKVLGLIPARRGSKGVPRKNIKLLNGKPLLYYTAQAALECESLARVILSTDCEETADIGRSCGLDVPFVRPSAYAQDSSTALDTIQHAIREVEKEGQHYDAICYLQPTSPLRGCDIIQCCIDKFINDNCDSVFTMRHVPDRYNPHWVFEEDTYGRLHISTGDKTIVPNRQQLPPAYHREGSVYITKRDVLMIQDSLYGDNCQGVLLENECTVNIDTMDDWILAESLIQKSKND